MSMQKNPSKRKLSSTEDSDELQQKGNPSGRNSEPLPKRNPSGENADEPQQKRNFSGTNKDAGTVVNSRHS